MYAKHWNVFVLWLISPFSAEVRACKQEFKQWHLIKVNNSPPGFKSCNKMASEMWCPHNRITACFRCNRHQILGIKCVLLHLVHPSPDNVFQMLSCCLILSQHQVMFHATQVAQPDEVLLDGLYLTCWLLS